MAIPAYLWLKDDGGAKITGSVDVQHREGSIEVLGFDMVCTFLLIAQLEKSQVHEFTLH